MAQQQLPKYKLTPPKNLVPFHKLSAELGYPDFYPPKPGQDEDQMTEDNVKKGFNDILFVQNEHFSAHDMIFDELKNPNTLKNLGDFMTDVMKCKNETNTVQGSSQFISPTIVWVPTDERDKWLRDLAGNAPLKVLAKSVPKGVEGKELLESVTLYRVPLARATWFTKIVGINKIYLIQNRGNAEEYTREWTNIFSQFIRDQSLHYDADKWRYSILLAKWQFDEQLLDQRLLRNTLDHLEQADHWQTPIWLWLVQQFLSEFQRSRTLMRLLIETIIKKLQDIYQHPNIIIKLEIVVKMLKNMLHTLFITTPDMFVFPLLWNLYKDLLRRALIEDSSKSDTPVSKNLKRQRERYFEMVRSRNEMFDDKKINPLGMRNARNALHSRMIDILDKINYHVDYHNITAEYFRTNSKVSMMEREVSEHIYTLCRWAITPSREGDFRVYSVSTMLDIWNNGVSDVDEKLERQTIIQSSLVEFLDMYSFGQNGFSEQEEAEIIARLFGVFTKNGNFSYQRYLQRLIARGDVRPEKRDTERSRRHLRYVKWFAIYETELHNLNHSLNQRWHILYGINSKDTQDKKEFDDFVNLITEKLPNMFPLNTNEMNSPIVDDPISEFNYSINFDDKSIKNATKFCQIRVLNEFLILSVKQFVQNVPINKDNWMNPTEPGSSLLNARQLATIIQIIVLTKDYDSLLELIIWVLENSMERSLFPLIVDTIKRHEMIWKAMGKFDEIFDLLMKKNDQLREKRATEICIVKYLLSIIHDPGNDKKSKLEQDLQQFPIKNPLSVAINRHRDRLGQDVKNLWNFGAKSSQIDSRLFSSESADGCRYAILESCTDVIHQHSQSCTELINARKLLGIFGDLLREFGDRSTDEFDSVFKKWLNNNIRANDDNSLLRQDSTNRFLIFFTILVVRHLVKIETVLEHLVGNNLTRLSHQLSNRKQLDSNEMVECRNLATLLRILLIHENYSSGIPLTIMEIQGLQMICESFVHNNDFKVISGVFHKLAAIESSLDRDSDLASELRQLRMEFSQVYWFRQLCIANVDNVYDRFVRDTEKLSANKEIKKLMINIVQSGLGYKTDIMSSYSSSLCFENLKNLFSTVNLWNIQKSRIEFYMYMDQIMLLDDYISESPTPASDMKELDGDSIMKGTDEDVNNIKNRVIEYFWEDLVLKGNNDCLIISHIIRGIREDVAAEILELGLTVLKRCEKLIEGIEEVFRALLLSVEDNKKLIFGDALLTQVQKINDENKDDTFVPCIMARIKLFVLVANVLAARVTTVVTSISIDVANKKAEYNLIMKWVVTLINLLCSERIHQNGGGTDSFDLILDTVSFLLDEMGKNARSIIVSELRRYPFDIPVIWCNRIKRVLPLNIPKETLGKSKHELNAWSLIEGIGESDDLNNSAIDLSWYDARFYQKPSKRLKRMDEYEDYNLDLNKKYNEANSHEG